MNNISVLDMAINQTVGAITGKSVSAINPDTTIYRKLSYEEFAAQRLKILNKKKELVPLIYNRTQRDLVSKLTGRDLVLKARQEGVSTAIQGVCYQDAVTGTATTMTLAHDDDGTKTLRRMADRFHRHDPQAPKRGAANDRLSTYPDFDSEALIATAGNKSAGRSTTLTRLHGSEVAYWPDAESIVAGALQAGEPQVILESTPNGAQGYFYQLCMEALEGNSIWTLHFYPWWWDEGYQLPLDEGEVIEFTAEEAALVNQYDLTAEQIKWRRDKQKELKSKFIQEYPEDPVSCFLMSGNGYFGDVSGCFDAPMNPVYDPSHRYVGGLDFGQTNDPTSLRIIDATANVEVASLRLLRLPWKEMRRRVIEECVQWHVETLVAEKNSMGSTNIEALNDEMKAAGCRTNLVAFHTDNQSKALIAGNLHAAIHTDTNRLKMQDVKDENGTPIHRREMMAFVATQLPSGLWKLAAAEGEHDDTVISIMLAKYGITAGGSNVIQYLPFNPFYGRRG